MNNVFEYFKFILLLSNSLQRLQRHVWYLISLILLLFCFQPAFAKPTTPTRDFVDNGDGTVTHQTTGLKWMRCAIGQTWTGSKCLGVPTTYTYGAAATLTYTFAGQSDWRLPYIEELHTIVERTHITPALNNTIFHNTPNDMFWSKSTDISSTDYAWVAYLYVGGVNSVRELLSFPVLLVRTIPPSAADSIHYSTPDTAFIDNHNDGTVTHKRTGLMWKRCSEGQTWDSSTSTCVGTASTYTYDAALRVTSTDASHSDWRVPNANELASIVDYDTYNPAINQTQFPITPSNVFWSSSPYIENDNVAWGVDFSTGQVYSYGYNRYDHYPVRLVRSFPTVTSVTPDNAKYGHMVIFTVTGTLLTPGMGFNLEDCYPKNFELPGGTVTHRRFRCMPGARGTKVGKIRSVTDNNLLRRFTISVY